MIEATASVLSDQTPSPTVRAAIATTSVREALSMPSRERPAPPSPRPTRSTGSTPGRAGRRGGRALRPDRLAGAPRPEVIVLAR